MAKLDELVVELTAETSRLRAELKNAVGATEKASKELQASMKEFSENSSKDVSFFETTMATMTGFLASNVVTGAFNTVKDLARDFGNNLLDGAKAAIENEKSLVRLANALAITGQYTKSGMADLEEYIDMQEKSTGISDDAVASSLSLLSAMTRLNTEGLKKASQAAIDLSSAYGMDLESATRLVGKGIEGNVESFKKLGITIRDGGDKASNLENILHALSGTSGAASGAFKSFDGQLDATGIAYEDYFKQVAKSVTENQALKAVVTEVAEVFREMTVEAENNSGALKNDVANALILVANIAAGTSAVVDALARVFTGTFRIIQTAVFAIIDTVKGLYDVLSGDLPDDPFAATKGSFEDLTNTLSEDTTLSGITETILRLSNAGQSAMGNLADATKGATEATVAHGEVQKEVTADELARIEILKSFTQALVDQTTAIDSNYQFQQELMKSNLELGLTSQEEYFASKTEAMIAQNEIESAIIEDQNSKGLLLGQKYLDAKAALDNKQVLSARALAKEQIEIDKATSKQRADNLASTFNTIATLSESGNKELAAIGKAAAITTATIDGFAAVQKALASAPPPFNFALAALVGVATAANVAKIAGVGLKGGIDSVPGVGSHDQFPAVLAPNERVVPAQTNKDLKEFLASQKNGGSSRIINLNITIQNNLPASREAGALMIEAINDSLANGSLRIQNI